MNDDRLTRIEADVRAIRQALTGFDGSGGGLIDQTRRLDTRVDALEQRTRDPMRYVYEGLRIIGGFVGGILGGRMGGGS